MTPTTCVPDASVLSVLEGIELSGSPNTAAAALEAHITSALRLGYPQAQPGGVKSGPIAIVGSGPSLADTFDTVRALHFDGVPIVTLNGAYHYLLERNIRPAAQVVLDARPSTARFLDPVVPRCKYFVASQCHPEVWATVAGRPQTFIWHAIAPTNPERALLDTYYGRGRWMPVSGGTTVFSRTLFLLRQGGWLRFHVFGVDSCWMGEAHHALPQPENATDRPFPAHVHPSGHPDLARTFTVSPWMLKQLEDLLQIVRTNGEKFQLHFHGDGLLAYALASMAQAGDVDILTDEGV